MTNLCSPNMATAGARTLRAAGYGDWDKNAARDIWDAMERQRIEDGVTLRAEATKRRAAANTPWDAPKPGIIAPYCL